MILKILKHKIFLHEDTLSLLAETIIVSNAIQFTHLLMERDDVYVPKSPKQSSVLYLFDKMKIFGF